jgi:hypothetical protein
MGASFWTEKSDHGWAVKKGGTEITVRSSQSDAWAETRRLARGANGDAYLKGSDGRIRAKTTYGKDPFRQKG